MGEVFINVAIDREHEDAGEILSLEPQDGGNVFITNRGNRPGKEAVSIQDSGSAVIVEVIRLVSGAVCDAVIVNIRFLQE